MTVTFNGENKRITVQTGTTTLDAKSIYSDWKEWVQQGDNAKYPQAFRAFGGDPTVSGQSAPNYFFLLNGWRIVVNNLDIEFTGNLYTQEEESPFVNNSSNITQRTSDASIVSTGDGGFTSQYQNILANLSKTLLNRSKINPATNQLEVYESDGTTVAFTFDLKDSTGTPSTSAVFERVPK